MLWDLKLKSVQFLKDLKIKKMKNTTGFSLKRGGEKVDVLVNKSTIK